MTDPPPKPPTLVRLLLGGVLITAGLAGLALGVPGVLGARADASLATTEGTVDRVSSYRRQLVFTPTGPGRPTHENVIQVEYSYTVGEKGYSGRRYAFDEPDEGITDDTRAQARIRQLQSAEAVAVLYDPADPSRAVLTRREMLPPVVVSVLGAVGLALGVALALSWRSARRSYRQLKAIHDGEMEWSPP